jgi:hypothetical protein
VIALLSVHCFCCLLARKKASAPIWSARWNDLQANTFDRD